MLRVSIPAAKPENTRMSQIEPSRSRIEIERKFLVRKDTWRTGSPGQQIRQGYLARSTKSVVRVRICQSDAWLTIKSHQKSFTRDEYEYSIPRAEAETLLQLCEGALIKKTRYDVAFEGGHWEVDVFEGENAGLVLAEIELASESEAFARPDWLGEEVSLDPRYQNSNLSLEAWQKFRVELD